MISLNLTTTGNEQVIIKDYLENNVSEILADKINNGVRIEKDDKTLLSKKSLDGFMSYACDEARKQSDKGAKGACIEDKTVFGWAIHYFEENSIEGKLYNEDGTDYKPIIKNKTNLSNAAAVTITPKPKPQLSLFDIIKQEDKPAEEIQTTEEISATDNDNDVTNDEFQEIMEELALETKSIPKIDCETGEVIMTPNKNNLELDESLQIILAIFGEKIIVR